MNDRPVSYNELIQEYKDKTSVRDDGGFTVNPSANTKRDSQSHAGMDAIQDNLKTYRAMNPSYDDFVTEEYQSMGMAREANYISKFSRLTYYRSIARHPDIACILDDYKNEILINDKNDDLCQFLFTKYGDMRIPDEMKPAIIKTADYIKDSVVDFNSVAEDLLMELLIDGELFFEIELDAECKRLVGLRKILPEFIDPIYKKGKIIGFAEKENEYDAGGEFIDTGKILLHHASNIVYINSGIFEKTNKNIVYSMLEISRKPFNQLLSMESSLVIRRLTRSPLMNVFNVNVNKMNPTDAQEYVKKMARTYKSKSVYDVNTGDFSNREEFLTSIKNYWFPKFAGDEGTTISTESFDTDFDTIGDVRYFELKLYKANGIPKDRYSDEGSNYSYDDTAKQQREIVFNIKASKWGKKFLDILYKPFLVQLFLEHRSDSVRWIKNFNFKLTENRIYKIYKELEILKTRIEMITGLQGAFLDDAIINDYFIMKNILEYSDEEIKDIYDMAVKNAQLQYTLERRIELEKAKIDATFDKQMMELQNKQDAPFDEDMDSDEDSGESFGDMERDGDSSTLGGSNDIPNADGYEPKGSPMLSRQSSKSPRTEIGSGDKDLKTDSDDVTKREKDFDFDNREKTNYDETDEEKAIENGEE